MVSSITIDGEEFDVNTLSDVGQGLVKNLIFVRIRLGELTNRHALLLKAKNAYIADLNADIVSCRSGVDLGSLFHED